MMSASTDHSRMLTGPVMPMKITPVTLEGQFVRLDSLSLDHHAALCRILLDDDIWRWIPNPVRTPDEMRTYIEMLLGFRDEGSSIPFATILKSENRVVGSTRFMTIDTTHHSLEIGSTLIGKRWQRTVVNTEAKYLMLRYAFETVDCLRVQFQTDSLNAKSRNALLRLGATQEGIFRNHKICADGRIRHSVYFSITDDEWPRVKAHLEAKLAHPHASYP